MVESNMTLAFEVSESLFHKMSMTSRADDRKYNEYYDIVS